MGSESEKKKPLYIKTIVKVISTKKSDASSQPFEVAEELCKSWAVIAIAQMGSLRGEQVMMQDLADIRKDNNERKHTIMPDDPLVDRVDSHSPHDFLTMIGSFKGKYVLGNIR